MVYSFQKGKRMAQVNHKKVSEILTFRRWNLTKLALEMSVSRSLVSLVLSGKRRPTLDFMERFIRATGARIADAFFLP